MKFSQRIGKTDLRQSLQIESIDQALSNGLWNTVLCDFFEKLSTRATNYNDSDQGIICKHIWTEFFHKRVDEIPSFANGNVYTPGVIEVIKKSYFSTEWFEKYDLIEFLCKLDDKASLNLNFAESCNIILQKEQAGYRIIDNNIVQITSEEELVEIESSLELTSKFEPVEIHLKTAIELLSNRINANYRNSIKESISAVESMCVILSGEKKATLGEALNHIEKEYKIHGALKKAFSNLYGYTSDSGGIRHSLMNGDIDVSFEDARFMLVICSAFVNYLKARIR